MGKVVRDGQVAVLYSPGFGAGWYSWNTEHPWLLFDPPTVELVLAGKTEDVERSIAARYGSAVCQSICFLGVDQLKVCWLPVGTAFTINEYDGFESVRRSDKIDYHTA